MKTQISYLSSNYLNKSIPLIKQTDDFELLQQKKNNRIHEGMSPASTCHSEGNLNNMFKQFPKNLIYYEKQQTITNSNDVQLGPLQFNLLGNCTQKYLSSLSQYIKNMTGDVSNLTIDFASIRQLQGLQFQKQQFLQILRKYNKRLKSTDSDQNIFNAQSSLLRAFLEEITYLCYEQVNLQLLYIIHKIQNFINESRQSQQSRKEFLSLLTDDQRINYISFQFRCDKELNSKKKIFFSNFLEKIFEIISEINIHNKVFQNLNFYQQNSKSPESIRNQLKLFSSQRDLWDSDDEDEFLMSMPNKKIKYSFDE